MMRALIISILFFAFLSITFHVSAQQPPCPTPTLTLRTRSPLTTFHKVWSNFFVLPPSPRPTDPCNQSSGSSGNGQPLLGRVTAPPNQDLSDRCTADYYRMPVAQNGEYSIYSCPARRCGKQELLSTLYTVAVNWNHRHPESQVDIGDLNASGHASHRWGVAVDIVTSDGAAANTSGSPLRSIELGKLFVDTNLIKNIWYCDDSVNTAVISYAREKNLALEQMTCISGHNDHFHVDINVPRGPDHTPSC